MDKKTFFAAYEKTVGTPDELTVLWEIVEGGATTAKVRYTRRIDNLVGLYWYDENGMRCDAIVTFDDILEILE